MPRPPRRPAAEIRGAVPRRQPLPRARTSVVLVVLDSCRWDALAAAALPCLAALGPLERRHSCATWTAPSHYSLLMGLLPFRSPAPELPPLSPAAPATFGAGLSAWAPRLGIPEAPAGFAAMLPELWLPTWLGALGMRCHARVSMPVLNPATPLARGFHSFRKMPQHNDLHAILDDMEATPTDGPTFWLINTGETHYPYTAGGQAAPARPHLPGVHGIFRALAEGRPLGRDARFTAEALAELQAAQVAAAQALESPLSRLLDGVPDGTRVIVTADHGELFGEDGLFGHGPVAHPKVLEVPYVEGTVRR